MSKYSMYILQYREPGSSQDGGIRTRFFDSLEKALVRFLSLRNEGIEGEIKYRTVEIKDEPVDVNQKESE